MNKILTIVRHVEAKPDLTLDIERDINEAGQKNLEKISALLIEKKLSLDRIICSNAKRSKVTAEFIAQRLDLNPDMLVFEPKLYLAYISDVIKIIKAVPNEINSLMIVGHNPSITELARLVTNQYYEALYPGSVVCLDIEVESWAKIEYAELKKVNFFKI